MGSYWILDGDRQPRKARDVLEWARQFEAMDRRVGLTSTRLHRISTVWLGLDHSHGSGGPPMLFETMVFDRHGESGAESDIEGSMVRYSTWDEAEAGHAATVSRIERLEKAALTLL